MHGVYAAVNLATAVNYERKTFITLATGSHQRREGELEAGRQDVVQLEGRTRKAEG